MEKAKFKLDDKVRVIKKKQHHSDVNIGEVYVIDGYSDNEYWVTDEVGRVDFGDWMKEEYIELANSLNKIESLKKEIKDKQKELARLVIKERNKSELVTWATCLSEDTGCFKLEAITKNMSPKEILKRIIEEIQ